MWELTPLENILKEKLHTPLANSHLSRAEGEQLYARYSVAKGKLCQEIFPWIRTNEPELSDHSDTHIIDVLRNIYQLIEGDIDSFLPVELYFLCLGALFHDVGNIYGRSKHNINIAPIYGYIMGSLSTRDEKQYLLGICKAHTGLGKDGTTDTLKDLDKCFFMGSQIRLRDLAAIIRFADELAEGEARTSIFMLNNGFFSSKSEKYHLYAVNCRHPAIDKVDGRIVLSYDIDLNSNHFSDLDKLKEFIGFIYERVLKLDQERRYCRYYSNCLSFFNKTVFSINFYYDYDVLDFGLNNLVLDDYVLPGSELVSFEIRFPSHSTASITEKVRDYLSGVKNV